MERTLTLNCASRSAWPAMISISSCTRSAGALSPNMLKLFRKSMNILNSAPVTSCRLCNEMQLIFLHCNMLSFSRKLIFLRSNHLEHTAFIIQAIFFTGITIIPVFQVITITLHVEFLYKIPQELADSRRSKASEGMQVKITEQSSHHSLQDRKNRSRICNYLFNQIGNVPFHLFWRLEELSFQRKYLQQSHAANQNT